MPAAPPLPDKIRLVTPPGGLPSGRSFPALAEKNRQDMKWKKFLYRLICQSEGFSFCTAPVCSECDDFRDCFGVEDGEGLLARVRNGQRLASISL